jgi:hypothetical protein
MTVDQLLDRLEHVRKVGRGWMALCPAHEDRKRSLSIAEGDDGRVLLNCFGGCTADRVTASLGLEIRDLFAADRGREWRPSARPNEQNAAFERLIGGVSPEQRQAAVDRERQERQAADNRRLRSQVRALELDQRRAAVALGRAALLISLAYSDDQEHVVERLWRGAVDQVEREAADAASVAS